MPPGEVLIAIALVSYKVICTRSCGPIELRYDAIRDEIVLAHPFADCPLASNPGSGEAVALALDAQARLAEHMFVADYEDPPVSVWAAA